MAIKFSQFNLRTESTPTMYLVGYDGNQNIHITVDNLISDIIDGTENTIAMFGPGGNKVIDSILSQDAGATLLTVAGQLNVDADATFDGNITVAGDSTLSGNVVLGDESADIITQTGTLYLNGPVKDTTDALGEEDQILVSNATGELNFQDLLATHVGSAEVVKVPVKNLEGSPLTKGDPVYISGSVGASGILEVGLADASNAAKMPAVGLLSQDLGINEQGFVVITGKLRNLPTSPIDGIASSPNDVIYVKGGGVTGAALTLTKPIGADLIQNMGKVGRASTSNDGTFVVSSILRTNDIPNLTSGKIWVGSTGNTIESSSITFTEATGAVQLNEYGAGTITGTATYNLSVDASGNVIETIAADDTNTTYDLEGVGSANGTAGVRLAGSDTTNDDVLIVGAGTTGVVRAGSTLTVTSNDQYTGTVTSVGTTAPLTGGAITTTGTIGITQATTSTDGYLSSTDWNTFNNKQDTITNPVTGTGVATRVAFWGATSSLSSNANLYWDNTNSRLGIGATNPEQKLHVAGNMRLQNQLYDSTNSQGALGQVLSKVSAGTQWIDGSAISGVPDGSGTANYTARWTDTDTLGTGILYDNATNVGIGTTNPGYKTDVVNTDSNQTTLDSLTFRARSENYAGTVAAFENNSGVNTSIRISDTVDDMYVVSRNGIMGLGASGGWSSSNLNIKSNGYVGIGNRNPLEKLHVKNGSLRLDAGSVRFYDGNTNRGFIGPDGGLFEISSTYKIAFRTGATQTEKMRLTDDGRLLLNTPDDASATNSRFEAIGTSSDSTTNLTFKTTGRIGLGDYNPDAKITVVGTTGSAASNLLKIKNTSNIGSVVDFRNSTDIQAGRISMPTSTTVNYGTTSDYRLKTNVVSLEDGIEKVKKLKPSRFEWIDNNIEVDGFIAHEVAEIIPEAVTGVKDDVDENNNPVYQDLDYSKIVPVLTAALQEAIQKIESLETRIQTLENQ